MGMLMIRCPKTGRALHTGKRVERTAIRATPVFFSQTYCPLCRATHEWFVKDAWICDSDCSECEAICAVDPVLQRRAGLNCLQATERGYESPKEYR